MILTNQASKMHLSTPTDIGSQMVKTAMTFTIFWNYNVTWLCFPFHQEIEQRRPIFTTRAVKYRQQIKYQFSTQKQLQRLSYRHGKYYEDIRTHCVESYLLPRAIFNRNFITYTFVNNIKYGVKFPRTDLGGG